MTSVGLLDLENVSFEAAGLDRYDHVWVVRGYQQHKKRAPTCRAKIHYIDTPCSGKNALDFVLTVKLGELVKTDPDAQYTVISEDRGYDPAIAYLRAQGARVQRTGRTEPSEADIAVSILHKTTKPRTLPRLLNLLRSQLRGSQSDHPAEWHVQQLQRLGAVTAHNGQVHYHLGRVH